MTTRWLICGGRYFANWQMFERWMNHIVGQEGCRPDVVISGCASGADSLAIRWAKTHNIELDRYPVTPAAWKAIGRKAGNRRNKQMLDEGKPTLVIAFPGEFGTADMVRRTREANVRLIEIHGDL